jgi:transcriptional regulator with XRE-family HTH domain
LEITPGALSQLERGETNYTRATLEALADALRCEPGDLLIRNPLDPESPWTIWEKLKAPQRRQAIAILKTLAGEDAPDIAA